LIDINLTGLKIGDDYLWLRERLQWPDILVYRNYGEVNKGTPKKARPACDRARSNNDRAGIGRGDFPD
jgi:hypothetical protein